MSIEAG